MGRVVFHNFWWVAVVNLYDELCKLSAYSFIELLEELKTAALRVLVGFVLDKVKRKKEMIG